MAEIEHREHGDKMEQMEHGERMGHGGQMEH
jgi:hypothetical protein